MQFQSAQFLFFFIAVFILNAFLNRFQTTSWPRNAVLVIASYIFYAAWKPAFLILILFVTGFNYLTGSALASNNVQRRKSFLVFAIAVNLGLLFYFKYFAFAMHSVFVLLGWIGFSQGDFTTNIILPIAISFITFEAISYNVDVYRGSFRPESNLLSFALYFAFFPRLVSGPIVRPYQILPQLKRARNRLHIRSGLFLVVQGLFKKVCVSDLISYFPNAVFKNPDAHSAQDIILAVMAFTVQIYCDFSGYTDIAIGVGRMLGIRLPQNFRLPYTALNIREFWQRWHITLSTWLRDYLYIGLGGNQTGHTYRNLFLTMLLGGLWHGASWNFVIWGALHGSVLVAYHWFSRFRPNFNIPWPISWVITQLVVVVAWIFFRADTFTTASQMITGVFQPTRYTGFFTRDADLVVYTILGFYVFHIGATLFRRFKRPTYKYGRFFLGAYQALLFLAVLFAIKPDDTPFIYFQF
ncbi:MAG: MBOAT family protein [Leptospirales bacterium]|nr:MBOAT family protein [Leptospirales bacterium]